MEMTSSFSLFSSSIAAEAEDYDDETMMMNGKEEEEEEAKKYPVVLAKTVGHGTDDENLRSLKLTFLGCERNPPYGPNEHTAQLLLDTLALAAERTLTGREDGLKIVLYVYDVQNDEYPSSLEEWNSSNGVLLPGSFSSACDADPWILKLKQVIQEQIVQYRRPTLAICFGHQILAHSFEDGNACKTPTGACAGRYAMEATAEGERLLGCPSRIDLFFTHGDMVEKLPASAVSLGGNGLVAIHAAAYFETAQDAALFSAGQAGDDVRPFAISFQAHPEYASSIEKGVEQTLEGCMKAMEARGSISEQHRLDATKDAHVSFSQVQKANIDLMVRVGTLLGWFSNGSNWQK
jgi:GMP synthase-like glutamine amidotransferase